MGGGKSGLRRVESAYQGDILPSFGIWLILILRMIFMKCFIFICFLPKMILCEFLLYCPSIKKEILTYLLTYDKTTDHKLDLIPLSFGGSKKS